MSILGLQAKKGAPGGGSNFGPNVKKPILWPKRGGGPFTAPSYLYVMVQQVTSLENSEDHQ